MKDYEEKIAAMTSEELQDEEEGLFEESRGDFGPVEDEAELKQKVELVTAELARRIG